MATVKIQINDREVEVEEGLNLIEAARHYEQAARLERANEKALNNLERVRRSLGGQ